MPNSNDSPSAIPPTAASVSHGKPHLTGQNISDGFLQHVAVRSDGARDSFRTERVTVKHEYLDRYLAYFEGRWRRVHLGMKRNHIIYQGERITIDIDGI